MGAGSPAGVDTDISEYGIVQGHAYAILRIEEETDRHGTHKLVCLRNPWGRTEWSGPYCDNDSERWTKRLCKRLKYDPKPMDEDDKDDGVFWMQFHDFVTHFKSIYLCRIFTDSGGWKRYEGHGAWKGKTAGGCPCKKNANAPNNPQ